MDQKNYASLGRGLLKTGSPEGKSGVPKRVSLQHSRAPFGQEAHAMHAKTYPSLSFGGQVKTNGRSARDLSVVSFENFSIQAKSFAVGIESERTSENMNQRPQTWHTLWYPHKPQYLCTSPHRRHETLAPKASPIWDSHGREAQYLPSGNIPKKI